MVADSMLPIKVFKMCFLEAVNVKVSISCKQNSLLCWFRVILEIYLRMFLAWMLVSRAGQQSGWDKMIEGPNAIKNYSRFLMKISNISSLCLEISIIYISALALLPFFNSCISKIQHRTLAVKLYDNRVDKTSARHTHLSLRGAVVSIGLCFCVKQVCRSADHFCSSCGTGVSEALRIPIHCIVSAVFSYGCTTQTNY